MNLRHASLVVMACLAFGCDAVPDLYVVDASVEVGEAGTDAPPSAADADAANDAVEEDGPTCTGATVSCPGCPPNPGACCANDVPCFGTNCSADCAMCATCAGFCCAKGGGPPTCHVKDSGKCPP